MLFVILRCISNFMLEVHVTCHFKTTNIIKLTMIENNGYSSWDNYIILQSKSNRKVFKTFEYHKKNPCSVLLFHQDKRVKRAYGYSPIGKRAEVKCMAQNWGPRITAIPTICTEGMIDLGLYRGNVNGATFEDFVDEKLCPNLLPFNGINPRSVVIMGTGESLATLGFWKWNVIIAVNFPI